MSYGKKLTAMGLAASVLASQLGSASAQEEAANTENTEQSYNILGMAENFV